MLNNLTRSFYFQRKFFSLGGLSGSWFVGTINHLNEKRYNPKITRLFGGTLWWETTIFTTLHKSERNPFPANYCITISRALIAVTWPQSVETIGYYFNKLSVRCFLFLRSLVKWTETFARSNGEYFILFCL